MENNLNKEISAIIINKNYENLKVNKNSSSHMLWGRSILNWVISALGEIEFNVVEGESNEQSIEDIKQLNLQSKYTYVLFSDMPLITNKTLNDALKMLIDKDLDVVRMSRGYVFKTEFLNSINDFTGFKMYFFDEEDFIIASSYKQMSLISDILKQRIMSKHMDNGVFVIDAGTTFIDADCIIESGVTIFPNNSIKGKSVIKNGAVLKEGNTVANSVINENAEILSSCIFDSEIGLNTTVGPNSYIRNSSKVGQSCRIGNFVEIKNSQIGQKTKIAHLTYVGDASVGEDCNVGCGVVFANYDGKDKHQTIVGDKVFIGSNCNLIAPVKLGDKSFIAAGSTVTQDVEEGKFCIARSRQEIKEHSTKYLKD